MLKADLSNRAFVDAHPPSKTWLPKRGLITAGGFQSDWAIKHGLPNEIWNIELVGIACCLYFLLWTASITTGLHVIYDFDRSFNPGLILIALLIASVQAVTDHITLVKPAVISKGEALLKTAAIKLPPSATSSRISRLVYAVRPLQGFAFAAVSVVFALLAALSSGIHAELWSTFQNNNPALFAEAARVADDQKARDVADLAVATGDVNSLTRTIASMRPGIAKPALVKGRGLRRAAANPLATTEELQKQLAAAERKRASLRDAVVRDDAERNNIIEKLVLSAPQAVPRRTDLAAQLGALWQLIADNPLMWVVSVLLLLAGCSLELGFTWVAASYPSAALCARQAIENYEEVTKLAKDGHGRLDVRPEEQVPDRPDDKPPRHSRAGALRPPALPEGTSRLGAENPSITPKPNGAMPKRPVGRPRKETSDLVTQHGGQS